MKVLLLTNEYPPHTYGGAGVHVEYLSHELARLMDVEVRCFGDQKGKSDRLTIRGFQLDDSRFHCPKPLRSTLGAVQRCTAFNTAGVDAQVVHCHTWYTHWGGILARKNYGIPLVITVHSLEPLRPWKREQLAGGYGLRGSCSSLLLCSEARPFSPTASPQRQTTASTPTKSSSAVTPATSGSS